MLNSTMKLDDTFIGIEAAKWRLELGSCPVVHLKENMHSHLRPITFHRRYKIRIAESKLRFLVPYFHVYFYTAPKVKSEHNPLHIKINPYFGMFSVFFSPYMGYKLFSVEKLRIKPGDQIGFEVTKMKPSLWWETARMKCPHEVNRQYRKHIGYVIGATPDKHTVHYLRNTHIPDQDKATMEYHRWLVEKHIWRYHKFRRWWLPERCQPPFWTNLYVVVIRDTKDKLFAVIRAGDLRLLDSSGLTYFGLKCKTSWMAFHVMDGTCRERKWSDVNHWRSGRVERHTGRCSEDCGGGYAKDQYKCKGFSMNGEPCSTRYLPGNSDYSFFVKTQIFRECNMQPCPSKDTLKVPTQLLEPRHETIIAKRGDNVSLDCLKEVTALGQLQTDGRSILEVHWYQNGVSLWRQEVAFTRRVWGPSQAGLYVCMLRINSTRKVPL